ncbi:MAG TPA: R3H domain-containing nucleic acid-binding protein [Pyrinomonadaceae bacterium]|jgi:spoIIIJ-associated protein
MSETCEAAGTFLQSIFDGSGLRLSVNVKSSESECVLDLDGPDSDLLQAEGGELLEALQHLATQAFGRHLPPGQRLVCDVHSFRATREAELRAMALHAAQRVRSTGTEFMFGPMNASERRIIHLSLADSEDLYTESIGQGSDRKLRVGLKISS